MTDIVDRLRERATAWNGAVRPSLDMDAADEIERLRSHIKQREDRDANGRANWEKIKPLLYPLGGKINDR